MQADYANRADFDLAQFCEHIRKLNNQLDQEEHQKRSSKSCRELLYQQDILSNQLIETYKITSVNLIKLDAKKQRNNTAKLDFNLIETHIEVCKLLVDLTSPYEQLYVNRRLIFDTFKKLVLHHCNQQQQKQASKENTSNDPASAAHRSKSAANTAASNSQTHGPKSKKPLYTNNNHIQNLIDLNISKFKEAFVKQNYFDVLVTSLSKLIDMHVQVNANLATLLSNTVSASDTALGSTQAWVMSNLSKSHLAYFKIAHFFYPKIDKILLLQATL